MPIWHTELERDLIRDYGGTPRQGYGVDGEIDGAPVEVRAAREDDRFRLGRDVHETLTREDGWYIFHDDELGSEKVAADRVQDIIGRGNWYDDRGKYDHRFVGVRDIF